MAARPLVQPEKPLPVRNADGTYTVFRASDGRGGRGVHRERYVLLSGAQRTVPGRPRALPSRNPVASSHSVAVDGDDARMPDWDAMQRCAANAQRRIHAGEGITVAMDHEYGKVVGRLSTVYADPRLRQLVGTVEFDESTSDGRYVSTAVRNRVMNGISLDWEVFRRHQTTYGADGAPRRKPIDGEYDYVITGASVTVMPLSSDAFVVGRPVQTETERIIAENTARGGIGFTALAPPPPPARDAQGRYTRASNAAAKRAAEDNPDGEPDAKRVKRASPLQAKDDAVTGWGFDSAPAPAPAQMPAPAPAPADTATGWGFDGAQVPVQVQAQAHATASVAVAQSADMNTACAPVSTPAVEETSKGWGFANLSSDSAQAQPQGK